VQAAAQEKFFSWFYLAINCGSAVAYGYLTTMGSNGGLGVPKQYGYFAVYAIAATFMLLAVVIFRAGRPYYRMQKVQERSSLSGVFTYVAAAARKGSAQAASTFVGIIAIVVAIALSVIQAIEPDAPYANTLTIAAFVCACVGVACVVFPCLNPEWLGHVAIDSESLTASEVKDFLRLLPVLFTANLAFSALYNSMQFWYQQQACQMDLRMPWSSNGSQFAGSFHDCRLPWHRLCHTDRYGMAESTP
jgi:hypothetical protein